MHLNDLERWGHDHVFGQHKVRTGERRTLIVIALTGTMMVVEITAGILFGSMALLADGLHMASHTAALGINAFAYVYARRHAHDETYNFGTGKINALGGYSGAVLLALFAGLMAWESLVRLVQPVEIVYDMALAVAVGGLLVNGASMYILGVEQHPHDDADHDHAHHHHDHNLKSAYLHVLADALTSLLAIFALLAAKYLDADWMDPIMGIVGAVLVASWSLGLLRGTSSVLLDRQGPEAIRREIRRSIEGDGDSRVTDLHVWSVGPGIYSAIVTVVTKGALDAADYKARMPGGLHIVHLTVEVHKSPEITS